MDLQDSPAEVCVQHNAIRLLHLIADLLLWPQVYGTNILEIKHLGVADIYHKPIDLLLWAGQSRSFWDFVAALLGNPILSGIPSLRSGIPLRLRRGGAKDKQRKFKRA